MTEKALLHHALVFGIAVIGERLDGDTATRIEQANDFQILGIHQLGQVLHDDVDTILVEIAVVAETEEIELQALAFHHERARDVIDNKMSKVGLTRLGTQGSKLRAIQSHKVFVLRMFVLKRLQHLGRIVVAVMRVLVAQQRHAFQFLFIS